MTEYVFNNDSLNNPEFKQADWKEYIDPDGNELMVVRIGDPFVVRTPQGEYIECKNGYLALDNMGEVSPIEAEIVDAYLAEKEANA